MVNRQVVLVEYFLADDMVILFGLRSDFDSPAVIKLPIDLVELRRFVYTNFGSHNRVRELIEMDLTELWHRYDYLIAPICQWAKPNDIVYLIPYGLLHYVPLHALQIDGHYLIERNPIVYCPSASVLKYCQAWRRNRSEKTSAFQKVVIVGDSRDNLPSARKEAKQLAQLFGTQPLLGESVTRKALLEAMGSADILHVAGHGYFHPSDAMQSGLQLAASETLVAQEIFQMKNLRTHLVVLSGCETGVNEHRPGDELIGLTRAFLHAGTPTLLVSLWRVSDASTAFLMEQFYRYLSTTDMLKVDALRRSILDTKDQLQWNSFYYWAPFILIGDWQ